MHKKNSISLKELASKLNVELAGDGDFVINDINTPEGASENDLILFSAKKYRDKIISSKSLAVIVDKKFFALVKDEPKKNFLIADDVNKLLPEILSLFEWHAEYDRKVFDGKNFISESAEVDETAIIMENVVIRDNVKIGKNTVVYSNTYIGENSVIGNNCVIRSNVSIYEGITVGNNVLIHSGVVIGSDGFGFNKEEKEIKKIPQIGGVVIEDNVEIGANTTIDRGTIGDTIIKKGTKIDNLVQIAHNDIIGRNVIIAGQSGVSGSSIIKDDVIIAGQVGVADHAVVEEGVVIGAKTGVTSRVVKKEEKMVFGIPAKPIMQAKRSEILVNKLPELVQELDELKKQVNEYIKKQEGEKNE